MSKPTTFWGAIKAAFRDEHAFTVIFTLTTGEKINLSFCEPYWAQLLCFEGTNIATQNPTVIDANSVIAYEIDY